MQAGSFSEAKKKTKQTKNTTTTTTQKTKQNSFVQSQTAMELLEAYLTCPLIFS